MAGKNFWDRRENIRNKPSIELRTGRIIDYVMDERNVAMGMAIELLIKNDGLYEEVLSKLIKIYPDINLEKGNT